MVILLIHNTYALHHAPCLHFSVVQALVWTTWALIGLLLLLAVLVFNSFPDYRSQKSWWEPVSMQNGFHAKLSDLCSAFLMSVKKSLLS